MFSNSGVFLVALVLLSVEGPCNAVAGDYPDTDDVNMRLDGGITPIDGPGVGSQFEDASYFGHSGTVFVSDGVAYIAGQRDDSGAEAVGEVLGTWAGATPIALLLLLISAWLLPGYYRRQSGHDPTAPLLRPGMAPFGRVLAVRSMCALAIAGATLLAGAPGMILLVVAGHTEMPVLALIGVIALVSGALSGWLYTHLGLLFADRDAVFRNMGPRSAIESSWSRARGRRLRRMVWALAAWFLEALGALGWLASFVGLLTHSIARAVADTMLTSLYLDEFPHV
ncbi:MAG: hypothetical protein DRJ42_26655 [Deltaproteobacteria bacterium]|nr:MAG: hypothetical protein DRJ42_26655 [Deltaproteobacteria bacterium]